jgi:adenosylcobyric acid synthase
MANFTDFAPLMNEPDVEFKYSLSGQDIKSADLLIIPGSKNTVIDLQYLREIGIEGRVKDAVHKGTPLVGVCGGYQMLGKKILDPDGVESDTKEIDGIGLLDTVTTLNTTKTTCQVSAELTGSGKAFLASAGMSCDGLNNLQGYEIHMGNTTGDVGLFNISRLNSPDETPDGSAAGTMMSSGGHCLTQ